MLMAAASVFWPVGFRTVVFVLYGGFMSFRSRRAECAMPHGMGAVEAALRAFFKDNPAWK